MNVLVSLPYLIPAFRAMVNLKLIQLSAAEEMFFLW